VSGQQHTPVALYPQERPGTHFTGDLVGGLPVIEEPMPKWQVVN